MNKKLMKAIWRTPPGFLTSREKFVLVNLIYFSGSAAFSIYLGLERISAETELTERCVLKTLCALMRRGIIESTLVCEHHRLNAYRINLTHWNVRDSLMSSKQGDKR